MARGSANVIEFPDLPPKGSPGGGGKGALLGPTLGTEFDMGQRLFAYYGSGDVFDYGEYGARDLKSMFSRNGTASALEMVLTLPIREADFSIEPSKGDKGECDFARGVLLTPDTEGGMKTPVTTLIGQITSAQIFRRAFFEKTFRVRDDGKIIYDRVAYRPPATCQARYNDRTGEGNGFRQQVWLFGGNLMVSSKQKVPGYVDIPKMRSYIYTHGKHREPLTGTSELEVTYWALAHGSEVQTPDGPVPIEDIQVGDVVFGGNGDMTRVTAVHPRGKRQMYRVTFSDKTSVECDEEHLWEVEGRTGSSFLIPPRSMVITTRAMLASGLKIGTHYRYYLPLCNEVAYPERDLPIDPYVLGAWIGDGCIGRITPAGARTGTPFMSCNDSDSFIIDEMRSRLPAEIELRRSGGNQDGTCSNYHIVDTLRVRQNSFRDSLVTLGANKVAGDKSIPEIYLLASPKQRWDLLRGLMDTDGGSDKTRTGSDRSLFGTISRRLALDVQRLVESLGGKASMTARTVKSNFGTAFMYRVEVRTPRNPFLLPRKAALWKGGDTRRSFTRSVVSIEPTTEQECTCITVAAQDGLFLTNHFIRTHNCHQTQMKLLFLLRSGTSSWRAWHFSASSPTGMTSRRLRSAPMTSPSCAAPASSAWSTRSTARRRSRRSRQPGTRASSSSRR
jgi:LAGLIDADG-like domain